MDGILMGPLGDDEDRWPAPRPWTDPRAGTPSAVMRVDRARSRAETSGGRRIWSTVVEVRLTLKVPRSCDAVLVAIDDRDRIELVSWWRRGWCAAMP
jgi:hypothetical protein